MSSGQAPFIPVYSISSMESIHRLQAQLPQQDVKQKFKGMMIA